MISPTIVSLAILKVNWDLLRKDYLENFVPIVAECIRQSIDDVVSLPSLREILKIKFGLTLPLNVIETILRRVRKRGYIQLKDKVYRVNREELFKLEFREVQQEVVRKHEELISSLISFCKEKFNITWSEEDAESALQSYLEENQLLLLSSSIKGTLIPVVKQPVKSARFLVGSFVHHIQETHASGFDYLETIVKGNMLANAIFLPEPNVAQKRFRNTKVYFDTPFLMSALGYAGKHREEPCKELIEILYETGAELCCFQHTANEIRGILHACSHQVNQTLPLKPAYGTTIEFFFSEGYKQSDIELFSSQLDKSLELLRIDVVEKPEYIQKYVIDEKSLSEELVKNITYRNPQALYHDVDSISAIMRLRKGREFYFVEECIALFVTTNKALVRVARYFFYKEIFHDSVAPCITDFSLTNLLWLKRPVQAPDLPRKRIIADCYAATRPREELWSHYLEEIDKLRRNENITADDYYLLRYSLEAKSAFMEITLGEEEAFTRGTVKEILSIVRESIQAELKAHLGDEARARKDAEKVMVYLEKRESERLAFIKEKSMKIAKIISILVKYLILSLLVIGTIITFPLKFLQIPKISVGYIISIVQGILALIYILNIWKGTTVNTWIRKIEVILSKWINNAFLLLRKFVQGD